MENEVQATPDVPSVEVTQEAVPVEQNAASQPESTEAQVEEKEIPAEKTFTQAELDAILEKKTAKLIRQREQERGRREAYEKQLESFKPRQEASTKPSPSNFNDVEKYAEAVADWKLQQVERQLEIQHQNKAKVQFETRVDDFRAELEEVVSMEKFNKLPISPIMAEAILESDLSIKLGAHLAEHPDEAKRIYGLSPARQAAEIGKLETKLSATTTVKASNAPPPIKPIGGSKTISGKNPSEMTMDEYVKHRAKEGARWAK